MKILQVFNNNVVLAVDELGRDVVLTGRGLGFKRRRGDTVDESSGVVSCRRRTRVPSLACWQTSRPASSP